ncbi:hypothetical protein K8F61_05275 [Microbacterium resistens]|uniref:50S ribosomal protein L29 n=1 Tax=Microbacterium resistens TaxID=156977 RepID=A0ABY3RXH1_9MICO|nr:hypothetical protein [Microbacterium resistens]UGS27601.1 hypothetical protein K8F61_05275 [Microbacterium resistens]
MGTKTARRIVDAIDDLTAELRLANQIEALRLGASGLDHDKGDRAKTDATRARVARMNALRADIRARLGIEETER